MAQRRTLGTPVEIGIAVVVGVYTVVQFARLVIYFFHEPKTVSSDLFSYLTNGVGFVLLAISVVGIAQGRRYGHAIMIVQGFMCLVCTMMLPAIIVPSATWPRSAEILIPAIAFVGLGIYSMLRLFGRTGPPLN